MWVLIDNYDSFTHILHHYLLQVTDGTPCIVIRNDTHTLNEIVALNPSRIILSPGPETPLQAGVTLEVIKYFHQQIPLLGVCLGHQALGVFYGARLVHAPKPMHGKQSKIDFTEHPLFDRLPNPFEAMRYHSLSLHHLPHELQAIAHSDDGVIQTIIHRHYPSVGVQFHPESVGTEAGLQLLRNWRELYCFSESIIIE